MKSKLITDLLQSIKLRIQMFNPKVEHTEFVTNILEKIVKMCGIKKANTRLIINNIG